MDDDETLASWNALANHRYEYLWHGRYESVRKWCSSHAHDVITQARVELIESMQSESGLRPGGPKKDVNRFNMLMVFLLEQLEQLLVSMFRWAVRFIWFLPAGFSRAVLGLSGIH